MAASGITQLNSLIDSYVQQVGPFGRYQKLLFCALQWFTMSFVINYSMMSFGALKSEFATCGDSNDTVKTCDLLSNCSIDQLNLQKPHGFVSLDFSFPEVLKSSCESTVTPQMGVVTICMVAYVVSGFIAGPLADLIGRKLVIISAGTLAGIAGLCSVACPNLSCFGALHATSIFGYAASAYPAATLAIESTGCKYRLVASFSSSWLLGFMFSGILALVTKSWKLYIIASNIIGLVGVLPFLALCESPRWLLLKHKSAQSAAVLSRISRVNGTMTHFTTEEIESAVSATRKHATTESHPILKQIRSFLGLKRLWGINSVMIFTMFVIHVAASGTQFNLSLFVASPYTLMIALGAIRLWQPPLFIGLDLKHPNFSRRIFLIITIVLTCTPFIASVLTSILTYYDIDPNRSQTATAFLVILGVSMNYGLFYYAVLIITLETYPTVLRNTGYAATNIAGGIGSIVGPPLFGLDYGWEPLRFVVIAGAFLVSSGLCILVLPETKGKTLPDTLEHLHNQDHQNGFGSEKNGKFAKEEAQPLNLTVTNGAVD